MIEIRPAGEEDNEQLLDLLGRCPRGTRLVVRQERHGDYFARSRHYAKAEIYAAWDEERIVGSLECALNTMRLAGAEVQGGYLYGLSVDPDYRRSGIAARLLATCEASLMESDADFSYCTVLDDNYPSLGLLGRSGYAERARLQQMIFISPRQHRMDPNVRKLQSEDLPQIAELLDRTYVNYDFFQPFTAETLAVHLKELPGFSMTDDVYVVEEHREITACLGCWQISSIVSSVILQWDSRLALMTRLGHFLRRWIPLPHIPEIGQAYRHCAVYPLAFRHSVRDLIPLWKALHQHVTNNELGSLSLTLTSSATEHPVRDAGYALRGGTSRLLIKNFKPRLMDRQKPVYLSPLD